MRNKLVLVLLFLFCLCPVVSAQKVGLVLSGGGAKGLTHIGIIRALEENNIPIDYITGTSMGAIIGSMYAMGYSPDEMEELIKSEEFKRWYSAEVEEEYIYYFKKNRPTPDFFNIRFSFKDSLSFKPQILPTSVIDPIQMNLVFIDLYARATAACKRNFDNLFVPFRCVASDVYNKKQIVMREGDLGDAVRASMSFPFVFKPININGVLAYDGGIYNNFPTDVMREDFHPDIVIGSVVSSNPTQPKENDLMSQMENMVMQKTNYSIPDSVGILMTFNYNDVNLMDFQRLDELHDIGYNRTMSLMDSIKARIHRRVNYDNIRLKRLVYKSGFPELRFKNIFIDGANAQQQVYIKKEFRSSKDETFSYEDLKKGYFRLLSDNIISEIIPHAVYDETTQMYDLHLKVKLEDNFAVRLGGNFSTSNMNQVYLGLSYQNLNFHSKEFILDGQLGKVYNNLQFMAKIDYPTTIPTSYRFIASISTFDYFKQDQLFSKDDRPAFNKKDERFLKMKVALPFMSNKRAELGFGIGQMQDLYFQKNVIDFTKDKFDRSRYNLLGGSIGFNGSTLNAREYPTQGSREALIAQVFSGKEYFRSGDGSVDEFVSQRHAWLQFSYERETYHRLADKWTLGSYFKALYASRNFSENYTATMMQACEFSPTAHSQMVYNESFRANQYFGFGARPIYKINQYLHARGEFYGFLPISPILKNSINRAYYGKSFSRFEYLGEFSVVCQLPIGSIAAYVNHYSSPRRNWNVGLRIGWQLFNYRFIE